MFCKLRDYNLGVLVYLYSKKSLKNLQIKKRVFIFALSVVAAEPRPAENVG